MTLPLSIAPGDTGHIDDHEEVHDLLDALAAPFAVAGDAQGLLAALPAAGTPGRYYFATDGPFLYRDDGSVWRQFVMANAATTFTAPQTFDDDAYFTSGRPWVDAIGMGASPGSDCTSVIQDCVDLFGALVGGMVFLPPDADAYEIDSVTVPALNVTVFGAGVGATKVLKAGSAVGTDGVFELAGLQPANFVLRDMSIDLDRASYADGTVAPAVFALRCTHVYVHNCEINNGSEDGVKARNSAWVFVTNCRFDNYWNIGVEFSHTSAASDLYVGAAAVPTAEVYIVDNCDFSDIHDGLYGDGSSAGIYHAINSSVSGRTITFTSITRNRFNGCVNDFRIENNGVGGTICEQVEVAGNHSRNCLQTSLLHIGAADIHVHDNTIKNCGTSGSIALGNDTCGILVSLTSSDNFDVHDNLILDTRGSATDYTEQGVKFNSGGGGQIHHNRVRLTSNPAQATLQSGVYVAGVTGLALIDANNLQLSGGPVGTIGLNFVSSPSGTFNVTPSNTISGFTTSVSGHQGLAFLGTKRFVSGSLAFGTVPANDSVEVTVSCPGAAPGDQVVVTPNLAPGPDLIWVGYLNGANTVVIRLVNPTVGGIVTTNVTWHVAVTRQL